MIIKLAGLYSVVVLSVVSMMISVCDFVIQLLSFVSSNSLIGLYNFCFRLI